MNAATLRSIAPNYTAGMNAATLAARAEFYADAAHQPGKKLRNKQQQAERLLFISAVRGQQVTAAPVEASSTPKTVWVMINGKAVEALLTSPPKAVEVDPIWKAIAPRLAKLCPKGQLVGTPEGLRWVQKGRRSAAVAELLTLGVKVTGQKLLS